MRVGDTVLYNGKVGTVRFAGTTEFKEGIWVGIELNEPVGKNDGSVLGVQYFKCPPKFGLFALPHKVQKIKVNKIKSPMSKAGSIANRSVRGKQHFISKRLKIYWCWDFRKNRDFSRTFSVRICFFIWLGGLDKFGRYCPSKSSRRRTHASKS